MVSLFWRKLRRRLLFWKYTTITVDLEEKEIKRLKEIAHQYRLTIDELTEQILWEKIVKK
jgi:hypothetical protein